MKRIVVFIALVFVLVLNAESTLNKGDRVFYKGKNSEVIQVVDNENVKIMYQVFKEHTNYFEKVIVPISEVVSQIPSIGNYSTGSVLCLKRKTRNFDPDDKVKIHAIFAADKIEVKTKVPGFIDWLADEIVFTSREFVSLDDLKDCPCRSCPP